MAGSASPAARLRALERALAKAKALKRGTLLSSRPMSELLGVSWPVLRDWCSDIAGFEESGAFVRGGNGIEWEFKPTVAVRFLIKHFERLRKTSAARAKRMRQTVAGDALEAVPEEYGLGELKQLLDVSTRFQDLAERQGRQVDVERVAGPLRKVFEEMRAAAPRAVQESDPNGRWPPETRAIVEEVTRKILLKQERAAHDCLGTLGGRAVQPRAPG